MKVLVIGAGPTGSVAAISALRAGHDVILYEEHARAGYPQHCSGLISKDGLDGLSDIVDYKPYVLNSISHALFDFAGERFKISRKMEAALVIDRAQFDEALAQRAEEEGAKVFYGKRFSLATGKLEARAIIGADGALSHTAHYFKFPRIGKFAFTLKAEAKIRVEDPSCVTLFYDNHAFPGFFGWLIPRGEEIAEIGFGTTNQKALARGWQSLLKKTRVKECTKPQGKLIPLSPRSKTADVFGKINVLLVGDAAGQVKSSSGGGVVFGTTAARLAGLLVHDPAKYEYMWRRELGIDMLMHSLLRSFFAAQPNKGLRLISILSRSIGLNHFFAQYGNMDRPTWIFSNYFSKIFNIQKSIESYELIEA